MILDSSMVEHSAVNRVVAGSSPARGANSLDELDRRKSESSEKLCRET